MEKKGKRMYATSSTRRRRPQLRRKLRGKWGMKDKLGKGNFSGKEGKGPSGISGSEGGRNNLNSSF